MNSPRAKSYIILIAVAAIWGAASPIIKYTLDGIDPLPFLAYRFAISAIFSMGFFLIKIEKGKKFKRLRVNFPLACLYGLLAAPLALGILFFGLNKSSVLDLTLIGVIGPLIVTAGGAIFFKDHITSREKIGITIVLIGVLINSFYPILNSEGIHISGNVLLLFYLLADGGSILIAKHMLQKKVKSANLTNLAFIIGALTIIPIALIYYGGNNLINQILTLPVKYHLGVWYMALVSGNLAYFLYIRGVRSIEISEAVLFNYLQPILTVPLAIFWLHESLSPSFIIGAFITAAGLIIAESKKKRYNN